MEDGRCMSSMVIMCMLNLQSIQKKMSSGSGQLPCLVILWYTVQCRALRNLKKGPKKSPQVGFEPQMYCYASGVNSLDFRSFPQFSALGAKSGRNPILVMAWFLEK